MLAVAVRLWTYEKFFSFLVFCIHIFSKGCFFNNGEGNFYLNID